MSPFSAPFSAPKSRMSLFSAQSKQDMPNVSSIIYVVWKEKGKNMESAGFVIEDTNDSIKIAPTKGQKGYLDTIQIPTEDIVSVSELE